MPLKLSKPKTATGTVEQVDKNGKTGQETVVHSTNEKVEVPMEAGTVLKPPEPSADVGYEASYTHNLGNYSSTRVQVTLRLNNVPPDEIDASYDFVVNWVDEKLNGIVAGLQADS